MKNNSRKTPRKPILQTCELVPITDPAEQAALDRRCREAEKRFRWTESRIRKLAEYHDNLTEDEQVAEIEAALSDKGETLIAVPTELVPEIIKLINKKRSR